MIVHEVYTNGQNFQKSQIELPKLGNVMFQNFEVSWLLQTRFFIEHTITPTCSFQQYISNVVLHIPIGNHLIFVSWVSMANSQITTFDFQSFFWP